jgi:hypothetical protein
VVALIALAYLTRAQALSFGPAILTAPLFYVWAQRRGWRALKDYRLMYGLVVAGGLLVIIVQVARGSSPLGILGAYQVAGETHYQFWPVVEWCGYQLGVLDLSLGVVPLAALIVLCAVSRGQDKRVQAFLAGSIAITFWLMLEVSAFASVHQLRVEERNTFYVVPLFLIALLVWIDRGTPRPGRLAAVAALAAAALPGALPYQRLITTNAVSDTLTLLPIWSLQTSLFPIEQTASSSCSCMCAAALRVLVPRRYALILPALILVYFAVSQKPIEGSTRRRRSARSSPGSRCRATGSTRRSGTTRRGDDLVGAGEPVRSGRTRSSTAACGVLLPALPARRRPPRAEGEGRSGIRRDAGRRSPSSPATRSPTARSARRQIAPPGPRGPT